MALLHTNSVFSLYNEVFFRPKPFPEQIPVFEVKEKVNIWAPMYKQLQYSNIRNKIFLSVLSIYHSLRKYTRAFEILGTILLASFLQTVQKHILFFQIKNEFSHKQKGR